MDFDLSPEQLALRATVRDLFADHYDSIEQRNAVSSTDLGWSESLWRQAATMGLLGLPFDEEYGGMGAGPVEISVAMEEAGRVLAPEPFVEAVYLPGMLISRAANPEQRKRMIAPLVAGDTRAAFAHDEPGSRWPTNRVQTQAKQDGDQVLLTGRKRPVAAADSADLLIVSALTTEGTTGLYAVDAGSAGLQRHVYRTHDERRGAELVFDQVPAEPLAERAEVTALVTEGYICAQTAQCAEAVGAMRAVLQLTVDYLKARQQFGVPLSTFQALTHRAADMYEAVELANSLTLQATAALADGIVDPVLASRAKLQVGRASVFVGEQAVQMHGGIGITREDPASHFLSRLTAISRTFGSTDDHLRHLASLVGTD